MASDESSKLLSGRKTPNIYVTGSSGADSPRKSRFVRPPLYTIPSSQSLKSQRSSSDLAEYLQLELKKDNSNDYQELFETNLDKLNEILLPQGQLDIYAYIAYYIPILRWLPQYNFKNNLIGDILASLCMTSFQIPLVMSFAKSLAHLPPITGLYSIIVSSVVYPILGTVPVLIVGPAPSSAIIYGQTIEEIQQEHSMSQYSVLEISSAMTAGIGGILLALGFSRFGFLDNVLSRALLKGFLAAMGVIMIINELAVESGINKIAPNEPHLTTIEKLTYFIRHFNQLHPLTFKISSITLAIVMIIRKLKSYLMINKNMRKLVYLPDLLLMIIICTMCCYHFQWYEKGVEIIGDMSVDGSLELVNPFKLSKLGLYKKTFHTGFLCTILGMFDSTIATKSLDAKYNFNVSSNRELIALGSVNFIASILSGLPSFGALGRSKINLMAGASSPMVLLLMAIFTIITTTYLLSYLHYLPDCVLALTTTIIGITVLEEIPEDFIFFWNVKGYPELITFIVVFLTTILWSAQAGVYIGVLISVVRVIRHSSKSNIQILGRVPNTNAFRNVDTLIEESFSNLQIPNDENQDSVNDRLSNLFAEIEEIEGILIIRIPEPLNFANVGDLKSKFSRIEKYGTLSMHPSQPITREFNTIKCIIFDCKGMDKIDAPGVQVLYEIIKKYIEQDGINVWFSRVPLNTEVRDKLRDSRIVEMINENTIMGSLISSLRSFQGSSSGIITSSLGDGFFLSIEDALKAADSQNLS